MREDIRFSTVSVEDFHGNLVPRFFMAFWSVGERPGSGYDIVFMAVTFSE